MRGLLCVLLLRRLGRLRMAGLRVVIVALVLALILRVGGSGGSECEKECCCSDHEFHVCASITVWPFQACLSVLNSTCSSVRIHKGEMASGIQMFLCWSPKWQSRPT